MKEGETVGLLANIQKVFSASAIYTFSVGNLIMIGIALFMMYISYKRHAEPLLLIPLAFGMMISNIPAISSGIFSAPSVVNGISIPGGIMWYIQQGMYTGIYPPLIFLGIGAITDFSFVLASPILFLIGGAAQIGIMAAFITARAVGFNIFQSASIGIIGGADGPTSIFITSHLAPEILGTVAVAAYTYIALIPFLEPVIQKLLTTKRERRIRMKQPRVVSKTERMIFPVATTLIAGILIPKALPLIGMLMLGNFLNEVPLTKRLADTSGHALLDVVEVLLMLSVGGTTKAETFLTPDTLKILGLGLLAFSCSLAGGVLFVKFLNLFLKNKINPLIGAAGVSAVPDAARVAQQVAQKEDPHNFILMQAMGPNVSGVIGSALVAGVFLSMLK